MPNIYSNPPQVNPHMHSENISVIKPGSSIKLGVILIKQVMNM
jgi:hypothetical protein